MTEAWIIDGVRSPRGGGKPGVGSTHPHPPAAHPRAGAQCAEGTRRIRPRRRRRRGDGQRAPASAITRWTSRAWRRSTPAGRSPSRALRCTASAVPRQQAVNVAAMGILAGHQELVVAGGVESMSRPASLTVDGFTANNAHLYAQYPLVPQGISADLIATLEGFTRDDVDALGVSKPARAAEAINDGRFKRSVVPIYNDDGTLALDHDEYPRPGTTMESLAGLNPSFEKMGAIEPAERQAHVRRDLSGGLSADQRREPRPPRRQLVRRRRWRQRGAVGVARIREGAWPQAARAHRDERNRRRRTGDHADRARRRPRRSA